MDDDAPLLISEMNFTFWVINRTGVPVGKTISKVYSANETRAKERRARPNALAPLQINPPALSGPIIALIKHPSGARIKKETTSSNLEREMRTDVTDVRTFFRRYSISENNCLAPRFRGSPDLGGW